MSGFVGGVECTKVEGFFPIQREESETWRLPGVDGYGILLTGRGDGETTFKAVLFSSRNGVLLWAREIEVMQGMIITIINSQGESYDYCFIKRVAVAEPRAGVIPGTAVTTRGELTLTVLIL